MNHNGPGPQSFSCARHREIRQVHNYDLRSMFEAPDMHGLKAQPLVVCEGDAVQMHSRPAQMPGTLLHDCSARASRDAAALREEGDIM